MRIETEPLLSIRNLRTIFDLDEGILEVTPNLEIDTVSLWISKIQRIDNSNSMEIKVSVLSNTALKGLQFQLYHTPFTKVDTTLETYTPSIAQLGEDKLFEDFTLLPKKNYSDEALNDRLLIEYSNDLSTFLDFDSLNLFLENEEYIFSHQYSNLVFYIDTTNSDVNEDGMWVYLTHSSDFGDNETATIQNPSHLFTDSLDVNGDPIVVTMVITTAKGCIDTAAVALHFFPFPNIYHIIHLKLHHNHLFLLSYGLTIHSI